MQTEKIKNFQATLKDKNLELKDAEKRVKEIKDKWQKYKSRHPNDPLCVQFKTAKKGGMKPEQLDEIIEQWDKRENFSSTSSKTMTSSTVTSDSSNVYDLNYVQAIRWCNLGDPLAPDASQKLEVCIAMKQLSRKKLGKKEAAVNRYC